MEWNGSVTMIVMSRRLQLADRFRYVARWLWPAAILAMTPKCLLCVFAYAGLATTIGIGGPEICGESNESVSSFLAIFFVGISVYSLAVFAHRRCREAKLPAISAE